MEYDVVIIGAGPSGLCFARMLAHLGLSIAVVERATVDTLASPAFDGREIALTHQSVAIMEKLGLWNRIPADAQSPLRSAHVFNGANLYAMSIHHATGQQAALGTLVANVHIRKAAYACIKTLPNISLMTEKQVSTITPYSQYVDIALNDGEQIRCQLLVAADSRFSDTRRMMGIPTTMHDFGRTMMVCAMAHDLSHEHAAWEWFDYGQTLALLPMNGRQSSVVITLPAQEIAQLMQMDEETFNQAVSQRFKHRLGAMRLRSTRHAYPLVTTYPKKFVAHRFALIGDAAVGMHPVTAHGFNFGLQNANALAQQIANALAQGRDIASPDILQHYEMEHRRATRPLFVATHLIAKLYGNDAMPARLLRHVALRVGNRFVPFKRKVAKVLTSRY